MAHKKDRVHLVPVSAKIPASVAAELSRLADAGDRTLSREVRRACETHITESSSSGSRLDRSDPAERREPTSGSLVPAGKGKP